MFPGFPSKSRTTPVPAQVFTELLPAIDDLGELKLTLYVFWRLDQMEGAVRYLRYSDFAADDEFMAGMGKTRQEAEINLSDALERATARGTLLSASFATQHASIGSARSLGRGATLYFINTPRGRAALKGVQEGKWRPEDLRDAAFLQAERPNIFSQYETHIGPLTPLIADSLRDAETTYPPEWIRDAFRIAVENNVRKWKYVQAILNSWLEKGRDDRENLRDSEKDRRKYTQGEFADFIER